MPSPPQSPPPPLPPLVWHLADFYSTNILPRLPGSVQALSNNLSPFIMSVVSAASNGDMVSLAAFLLTVYLSLKIADYIRRSVISWVIFLVKIALLLVLVNCAFYVNRYGWHQALNDAEWVFSLVWGYVEDKVLNTGDGTDNRTGWYGGGGHGYGARTQNPWNAYGGGRQQVPVARGRQKEKSGYGWT